MTGFKILFVSPEVYPFAKTGGLADVAGSLPVALSRLGHDVRVIMPRYQRIKDKLDYVCDFSVNIDDILRTVVIKKTDLAPGIPIHFVECYHYFDRQSMYDFDDDAERFIFFSRAVLKFCKQTGWKPDIVHANDWQTGLLPLFIRKDRDPFFSGTASVFTIHNLGFQGKVDRESLKVANLGWEYFTPDCLEYWGNLSLLKAGLLFSDAMNTVSQGYAAEIQTAEYGMGFEGLLSRYSTKLHGIINGLDYSVWDPENDPFIAAKFGRDRLEGKAPNKAALQKEFGLEVNSGIPLLGNAGRLSDQKGIEILCDALELLKNERFQFVLHGTGEKRYMEMLEALAAKYSNVKVNFKYDEALCHRVYAGLDMYLMPSYYEPCGLSQLISFKYGAVPVVRSTGGLQDTVKDYSMDRANGSGFTFKNYDGRALADAVKRAMAFVNDRREWSELVRKNMALDYSWKRSAESYVGLYKVALDRLAKVPVSLPEPVKSK